MLQVRLGSVFGLEFGRVLGTTIGVLDGLLTGTYIGTEIGLSECSTDGTKYEKFDVFLLGY